MSEESELNTRGLLCPLPVIRTQDAIKGLNVGDKLTVWASDPGTMHDIPAWARVHGHKIVAAEEKEGDFFFVVEVC